MIRRILAVLLVLACVAATAQATPILTTGDTLHLELFNWNAAGTLQKAPESLFVVVYNPVGDSIYGLIADTTHASLKGPYLRRRGNGGTLNVYNWAQPISVIDSDDGEGLYHISIFIGAAEDTGFYADAYFQLVDLPLNTQLNEIAATLDTVQSQDGWVAQQATLVNVRDTVNAILDTAQLQDGWVAQQGTLTGTLTANMTQVSGDATAADNFETMLDGTGGQRLTLSQLRVVANATDDTAVVIYGADNGFGIYAQGAGSGEGIRGHGGATGSGIEGVGGGTSGNGINALATLNGWGFVATGVNGAGGILAQGTGTNSDGFKATATGTGRGVYAVAAGTSAGVRIEATDADAMQLVGGGANAGLRVLAGATGVGAYIQGGATSGDGLQVTSVSGDAVQLESQASGDALKATAAAGDGFELTSTSGGVDLNATLNLDDLAGTLDASEFGESAAREIANVLGNGTVASSLTGASTTRIPVTPGLFTQANDFFNDQTLRVYTGSLAGQVARIVDFVSHATADTFIVTTTVGTIASGDSFVVVGDWAEAAGVASVSEQDKRDIANYTNDSVWLASFAAYDDVAGSFGDSAQGWGATSASPAVTDTVNAILDSIQNFDVAGHFMADIQAALDSLNLYDNAGRFQEDAQAILDSLQAWDAANGVTNDIQAILDTLRTHDGWVAQQASLSTAGVFNTTQRDSLLNALKDNLRHKVITANDTADNGGSIVAEADPLSRLITIRGVVAASPSPTTTSFAMATLTGANDYINGSSILFVTGTAQWSVAQTTDFVASNDAVTMTAVAVAPTAGDSVYIVGLWSADPGGSSNWSNAQRDSVLGVIADAGKLGKTRDTIYAILDSIQNFDVAGHFMADIQQSLDSLLGYDNAGRFQTDIQEVLDSIQAWDAANGVTNDIQAILDSIRNFDVAGHLMADIQAVLDSLNSQDNWVATSASIAALNNLSATQVWNIAFNTAWTAGSMGDSLNNASYVQGSASGLTATQVADSVWKSSFAARYVAASGSFADSAKGWGQTAASSFNPATDSVLVKGAALAATAGAISATTIAGGAITVSEAPNLDAAVSSRLAPTVAARTLDVTATGEAGVDLNNTTGTLSGGEVALTQAEFTPDYAVPGDAMTLTGPERAAIADSVNAELAKYLVDSLNQVKEASRLVAIHQGIVPSVYDSAKIVMYPGAWTPNKDSLKAFVYSGPTIDTLTMNRYRWGYWIVGSDSTAVADTIGVYKR